MVFLEGSKKLGIHARSILRDEQQRLLIPSIVLAEAKDLTTKEKTRLSFHEILDALNDLRCSVYPLDLPVIRAMPPQLDIHDAIICGTALVYQELLEEEACLITRDEELVRLKRVKTIW